MPVAARLGPADGRGRASSRQIGASLGLAALGTVAQHRTGASVSPRALADGYGLGLTMSGALLVAAVLVAVAVLRRPAAVPLESSTVR